MKKMFICLCAGSVFSASYAGSAESVYTIQLGAFKDEKSALQVVDKYSSTTSSAFLRSDPQNRSFPYKVGFGEFSSYMDAWAVKSSLGSNLPKGCFIAKITEDNTPQRQRTIAGKETVSRKSLEAENHKLSSLYIFKGLDTPPKNIKARKDISESRFVTAELQAPRPKISDKMLQTTVSKMSKRELVAMGFDGPKNSVAASSLEEFLKRFPNDSEADVVRLRLARRLMARREFTKAKAVLAPVKEKKTQGLDSKARLISAYIEASHKGSLQGYKACSEIVNDPSVDEEIRLHAMRLAAGHAHASNNLTTASLIFKQLEEVAPSREEQLEASLQRCGIMFELAGRGKGSWQEAREYCQFVTDSAEASHEVRSTAALIGAETLVNDRMLTAALSKLEILVRDTEDLKKVHYTADILRGIVLCRMGREQEAEPIFQRFVSLKMLSSEKFRGNEPDAQALLWLAWIANNKDDSASRNSYLAELKKRYPKSLQLKKAEALYGLSSEVLTIPSL